MCDRVTAAAIDKYVEVFSACVVFGTLIREELDARLYEVSSVRADCLARQNPALSAVR